MRRVPFYPLLITILVSFGSYLGCDPNQVERQIEHAVVNVQNGQSPLNGVLPGNYPPNGYPANNAPAGYPPNTYPSGTLPNGNYPSGSYANGTHPNATYPSNTYPNGTNTGANTWNSGTTQRPGFPVSKGQTQFPQTPIMALPSRTAGTILIGSFNLMRLGPTKIADRWTMERFADIIRRFDVIALQEITSSDANTVPTLLKYVNANGARYEYTISPPIGRTLKYTEQYAFVYDSTRVTTRVDSCFVMRDEEDLLHREPFVGRFMSLTNAAKPFSFVLINMHTDPDEIGTELDTLARVYVNVADYFYNVGPNEYPEDDVILLGDLNADPNRLQALGQLPNVVPTIVGIPTNFTRTKTNDNILVNRAMTREFTGRSGVIDLQNAYSLTQDEAKRLSDHIPVWAEFTIQEAVGAELAAQPAISYMRY